MPDGSSPTVSGTPAGEPLRAIAEEAETCTTGRPAPDVLLERIRDAGAVVNIRSVVRVPPRDPEQCPKP